jgi:hypothetical protein
MFQHYLNKTKRKQHDTRNSAIPKNENGIRDSSTNGVVLTNGATAWASASDERMKDVAYMARYA